MADFSRLIDSENDAGMKALEEILWTETLWKCALLSIVYTADETWKWLFDTLKIWEWTAEWMLVNENKSVPTEMRLEAMLKWVGIDALRAMAIIPWAKTLLQWFAKILNKIKLPVNSNIWWNLIWNEIWAVWDIKSLRQKPPKEWLTKAELLTRKVEEMQYNISKYKEVFKEKLPLDRLWIEIENFWDKLNADYFIISEKIRQDTMITLLRLNNNILSNREVIATSNLKPEILKSFADFHRHLLPYINNAKIDFMVRNNIEAFHSTVMTDTLNMLLKK